MNTIEQATKRIEELRRAGVQVPWGANGLNTPESTPNQSEAVPKPERTLASQPDPSAAIASDPTDAQVADDSPQRRSRSVEINLDRLVRNGYLVPGQERSLIEEEFRIIKRPLLRNATGEGAAPIERGNLIMVTSAVPGEGKTFTSVNLAISLAMELDHTVLLVDGDVIRPSVLDRLGLPTARGLLDLLIDPNLDMADVMLKTNIPKLTLLPAGIGKGMVSTTELLASGAMEGLLNELAHKYKDRIIVFDAPPLLPSTESRVLAHHMGQIVVVVEADNTPKSSVLQAFSNLDACPVVMSVLNKCRSKKANSAYGYYSV